MIADTHSLHNLWISLGNVIMNRSQIGMQFIKEIGRLLPALRRVLSQQDLDLC